MAGIDLRTGKILRDNWLHTLQSIETILSTRFGERVERRLFGSPLPHLLGENLTPETWLRFLASVPPSLAVKELNGLRREPRYTLERIQRLSSVPEVIRAGRMGILMEGLYRPRGHLGDPTPEGVRRIVASPDGNRFKVEPLS